MEWLGLRSPESESTTETRTVRKIVDDGILTADLYTGNQGVADGNGGYRALTYDASNGTINASNATRI